MSSNTDNIRVTCRYRPVNKVESEQPGNTIVTKVSGCNRATLVTAPDRPQYPYSYSFDRVYPSGVSQREVYEYTGKPLIEAMKQGYNSTLFAYGQTGSGKTFSMMGIQGNSELQGIQPRIIEDVFDYIENEAPEDGSEYTVEISMLEIYRERIRDLLNPVKEGQKGAYLRIRDSKEEGIYVENLRQKACVTAAEVLATMDNGFESRVTKKTAANPMSSRSHCMTVLRITKFNHMTQTRQVTKIKMVDLAGSEKTSKTGATGDLMEEAKAINASLTALSKCLYALSEGRVSIPFRDSKLTRLLQDALGGNSKTSLLLAVSPCSYNVEETLSTLRFGKAAKQVKNVVMKNITMSSAEMERQIKKLSKQNDVLTEQVGTLKLQAEAASEKFGGDWRQLLSDLAKKQGGAVDFSTLTFNDNSDQMYMLTHKGEHLAGKELKLADSNFSKISAQERLALQMLEWEKLADIVGALIRKGDFEGVADELEGKIKCGSVSAEAVQSYQDQIDDLRAELRETDSQCDHYQNQLEDQERETDRVTHALNEARAKYAEMRLYKQKVQFLEAEVSMTMKQLKTHQMAFPEEEAEVAFDLSLLEDAPASPWAKKMTSLVQNLSKKMAQKDGTIKRLQGNATLGIEDILERLDNQDQAGAVKKILEAQATTSVKLAQQTKKAEQYKTQAVMVAKRHKGMLELQKTWQTQLKQMEQAVLLCRKIQVRDSNKFKSELELKEEQIARQSEYIKTLLGTKAEFQSARSSSGRIVNKKLLNKKRLARKPRRKQRPRSNSPDMVREARAVQA